MTHKPIESKEHVPVILDERTSDVLARMFNFVAHNKEEYVGFLRRLEQIGLLGSYCTLFLDTMRLRHQKGWCKDPDCQYDEKEWSKMSREFLENPYET